MTHPMLEKVARAISGLSDREWDCLPDDKADRRRRCYDSVTDKAEYLDDARAAVRALLEPDDSMIEAGCEVDHVGGWRLVTMPSDLRSTFPAMLLPLIEEEAE